MKRSPEEPAALHRIDAPTRIKGRGAASNREGRFESIERTREDDGWYREDEPAPRPDTVVTEERARSIISRNDSPDIHFEQSINPYRGCEHGCVYCYARPSHFFFNDTATTEIYTLPLHDALPISWGSCPPASRRRRSRSRRSRSEERRVGKECRSRWTPYH